MGSGRERALVAPPLGHASTSLEIDSNESLAYWLLRDSLATAQQRASFVYMYFYEELCLYSMVMFTHSTVQQTRDPYSRRILLVVNCYSGTALAQATDAEPKNRSSEIRVSGGASAVATSERARQQGL